MPNVGEKGLRIERLDMKASNEPNKFNFSLLLTQVVEKHEYIQGSVVIKLLGQQVGEEGTSEKQYAVTELNGENSEQLRFRFRYFQNIDNQLTVPEGFEPREITIVAQSSGRNSQRLEKKFDWQIGGD